jgi:hypothetical protein
MEVKSLLLTRHILVNAGVDILEMVFYVPKSQIAKNCVVMKSCSKELYKLKKNFVDAIVLTVRLQLQQQLQ